MARVQPIRQPYPYYDLRNHNRIEGNLKGMKRAGLPDTTIDMGVNKSTATWVRTKSKWLDT